VRLFEARTTLFEAVWDYVGLFEDMWDYLRLFEDMWDYLRICGTI
jgi:hypothetical protein